MNKKLLPAFLLTLVNVLGFSILMPVLPFIIESYDAPKWVFGLLLTCYSAFQFIGAPILGAMSDAQGRKPILLISQTGTLISWFIFIFALALPTWNLLGLALPLWVIGVSRILDGITGGNASVTNAYVADITTRNEKSYIFGYLGGIAGLGMIIGPGLGGLSASTSMGFTGTLLLAAVISSITLISIHIWLRESHPTERRVERKRPSIWRTVFIPARVKEVNPSPIIKVIFIMKFFFSSMMGFYIGTMALFLIDIFQFTVDELGFFMFFIGLFLAFNQAFLSKQFIKWLGEFRTLILGLALGCLGLIAITMTDVLWLFVIFYYILNLGLSLCFPTFNALIAINANPKKQGEIMGISESINSFCMAIFPVISAGLYGYINYHLYHWITLLPLTALVLAVVSLKKRGKQAFIER